MKRSKKIDGKRVWNKKDLCTFCFDEVSHFSRHLIRHHRAEDEVKAFLELPAKDYKRKLAIEAIRKRGNFDFFTGKNVYCPVKRPNETKQVDPDEYTPCSHCLGLFKKSYLYRHVKVCHLKPADAKNKTDGRSNPVGESQTLLVCLNRHGHYLGKSRLKTEVFPIMAPDEISKVAKNDPLICFYGESHLKKHKRKQIINKISNDMREMGRLLLEFKKREDVEMFDLLTPERFPQFIESIKIIAGYNPDPKKHSFKSPSFALHMRTNLVYLCAIGEKVILMKHRLFPCKDRNARLKEVKQLKLLIRDHYASEISSLALKDLNEKKWNKQNKLPKTSDIKLFQNYVSKLSEEAYTELQTNPKNPFYYKQLSKTTLALTVLINRKRIGEVQYLKIETYNRNFESVNQEEMLRSLTQHEKELSTKFKRVVTGGKGSRPVTVLFPKKLQRYADCLVQLRGEIEEISPENPYLFAGKSDRWMSGYHVIRKLSQESGAEDCALLTSTRFRKHLATIMQILNFEDDEMEQIARFMGHTRKTHDEFYR